ncbi:protein-glutamine gamma-glutamyltransferase [Bacillus carboniphilus]|uniref:Protein-glutamine gamma-glutamyltransferase n=1 Tax=Bacillus carboniphilus TaxID=86663 RepID=A0ABY9JU77_9BACI|nr:protein-glutamine gamma-glutamyltransferase [Bacillus carboniphilus]WLR41236.1 protein-glutamine gamma-glutamyltransferase [Bacillus carboniphilus]
MIQIQYQPISQQAVSSLMGSYGEILSKMIQYKEVYQYNNLQELAFELYFRKQTMKASVDLNKSGVTFAVFKESFCNPKYWRLTNRGAFVIKSGIRPRDAIRDIFLNGKKYAFECATAIVIIFYKAALQSIKEEQFDQLFSGLTLYDWHYDDDLGVITKEGNDYLQGDCVYFKNPDVNPLTPEWRGENCIILQNDLYFGHGIGIKTGREMIEEINQFRIPGATRSAYLLSQVTRPNYQYLSQFKKTLYFLIFRESGQPLSFETPYSLHCFI